MQNKNQLFVLGLAALGMAATGAMPAAFAAGPVVSAPASAAAGASQGQNTITRLDIAAAQDGTRIVIEGSQPFTPDIRALDRPSATVITVPGVWNDGRSGYTEIRQNSVYNVRTGAAQEGGHSLVRIVANTRSRLTWTVHGSAGGRHWEVLIQKPGTGSDTEAMAASAPSGGEMFASSGGGADRLRSAMDRRADAPATAATQVASSAVEKPLLIPAISLRQSSPAPALTAAKGGAQPALHEAGLAASDAAAPRPTVAATTESVTPSAAPAAKTVQKSVAASVQPLHAVPLALHVGAASTTAVAAALPTAVNPAAYRDASATAPTFTTGSVAPTARRVSLDFVGADISEVLKALAVQSGINVILATGGTTPSGAIQSKITVSLHHVSFAEALDTVVNLSGYKYARIGSTYAVGTPEAIAALVRGASVGQMTTASIPFIFSDGNALLNSILAAFPTMRGRVTLVSIGSEGRTGAGLATTGLNGTQMAGAAGDNGAAANGNGVTTAPAQGVASDQTTSGGGAIARVIPKGGVINVSGSTEEIEAVRTFVESTERALIQAPYAEQEAQSKRFAGLETQVYQIKYTSAPELVQILTRLVPSIYVTPGPTQAFKPNSTGQSLSYAASPVILPGGNVVPGAAATGGPATTNLTVTSSTTTLLLTGLPEDLARARDVLDKVDIRVTQVAYEAKVVDISTSDAKKLGLTYDVTRPVEIGEANNAVAGTTGLDKPSLSSEFPARTPNFGAIFRSPYTIQAQLQAVVNNNRAKVLSNPNLTALDGQTATAFIGDQIKYVSNIQQTTQGQNVTTETATVGITLKVTGRTSPDGTITLYVHPEVSSITQYLNVGNGISLPQISTRFVDTTIRVKDGETIAIAGLISDSDAKNLQKVPVLGDIPFFGELFKYRSNTHDKRELVVFITTHLAKD